MCGGSSVWVPCSRVSHVYRGHSCSSCHSGSLGNKFGGVPTTLRNYKRVIETWFDPEYREYFYTREPLARLIDHGDISAQLKMKEDMKCKSFDWFMTEIAYDVLEKYPKMPPNKHWGELKNQVTSKYHLHFIPDENISHHMCRRGANALTHLGDIHLRKLAPLAAMVLGGTRYEIHKSNEVI